MFLDFMHRVFESRGRQEAIVWKANSYTYAWLLEKIRSWEEYFDKHSIEPGSVIAIEADFSPNAVALFLSLINRSCILVPLTSSVESKKREFFEIAQVQKSIQLDDGDKPSIVTLRQNNRHPLYEQLTALQHPGLVLFSSGSTGRSKAAVHDFIKLLEKFRAPRRAFRTISFLLYDHIGGANTMLHTLSSGGTVLTVPGRSVDKVLSVIEAHRAELLPASPTFLNLILLSEGYKRYDLSSLRLVTYGTEPMLESTLNRLNQALPGVVFQQTYGLSELGILRAKSKDSSSLWVKIGGEGVETRIVDGILHIKTASAMLGYLNAPAPFLDDGWFDTQDQVEVDGEYIRILGRTSEIINVGGEKVYPAEVESIISEVSNIADVVAYGEKNAITGCFVCARVALLAPEDGRNVALRIRQYCASRLPKYKIPVRILVVDAPQHGERFKKIRFTETSRYKQQDKEIKACSEKSSI